MRLQSIHRTRLGVLHPSDLFTRLSSFSGPEGTIAPNPWLDVRRTNPVAREPHRKPLRVRRDYLRVTTTLDGHFRARTSHWRIETHCREYHIPVSGGFDSQCNSPSIVEQAVQDVAVAEHEVLPRHFLPSLDSHTALPSPDWEDIEAGVHALRPRRADTTIEQRTFLMDLPLILVACDL